MMFKGISVVLVSVKYVTYNIPTTSSRPIIDALQILATCKPQYHKSILPRAEMGILIRSKFASSSEFQCDSNALIFCLIGRELSELREFYKIPPEMENFRSAPSVLQTAVKIWHGLSGYFMGLLFGYLFASHNQTDFCLMVNIQLHA
jgi:hypothetical protein